MDEVERAVELWNHGGLSCSQAMLTAFGGRFGLGPEPAKLLGRGVSGGLSHLGLTCGAVVAAMMILGMATGGHDKEYKNRTECFDRVGELVRRFTSRHGSISCLDLLGVHLGTEEGMRRAKDEGIVVAKCHHFVRDASQIVLDIIEATSAR
jgi:C_GCAxxG_C_C family probable redox protein